MIRGTTAVNVFRLTRDFSNYSVVQLTYSVPSTGLHSKEILTLQKDRMTFTSETVEGVTYYLIQVTLTQEETLSFPNRVEPWGEEYTAEIQLRFKSTAGVAEATLVAEIPVKRVLKGNVI